MTTDWHATIRQRDPLAVALIDRQEMAWVAALDGADNVRAFERIAQGGCASVQIHLPPLLSVPLRAGMERFILLHNHPSGSRDVSPNDRELTKRVLYAATTCGLIFEDHVIVLPGGSMSLVARGVLAPVSPSPTSIAAE